MDEPRQPQTITPDDPEVEQINEFLDLETTLTVYQLLLLLGAASEGEISFVDSPIWVMAEVRDSPLMVAPYLPETALQKLAQARALKDAGFLRIADDEDCWEPTAKGKAAVSWWSDVLRGLMLPEENAASQT